MSYDFFFFSTAIGSNDRERRHQISPQAGRSSVTPRQLLVENVINSIPISDINEARQSCKSMKNFAKRRTFKLFTKEERRGRNCTGWVPAKVQPKKKLDQIKLEAVKILTFKFFKVENPNYRWKRECIKAIDTALRNESAKQKQKNSL